jgi:hypothetical protein
MSVSNAASTSDVQLSRDVFEFAVVDMVLTEHPRTFTEPEVIVRVSRDRPDFEGEIHEAIRELVSFGVLHREGERLHGSLPAIRVYELADHR